MAYLVTGGMGCLGAWALFHLVKSDKKAVCFDLSESRHRLNMLLTPDEQASITFVKGDITSLEAVRQVCEENAITHIIHLAALQVPFCRNNPSVGAQVNVTGTINVFEAAREIGVNHVAYASSIAVYGAPDLYPAGLIRGEVQRLPTTLYGVYKVANEDSAKIYFRDWGVTSTGLRPYTVYGVGRDQGMTSEPTKAMQEAALGKDAHISFAGKMQFHFASDVAQQFILASEHRLNGAYTFNMGTAPISVMDVAQMIADLTHQRITVGETILPFPEGFDTTLHDYFPQVYQTLLDEGIRQTITHFRELASL
ncbi:MAG: NAD(P)-dependent oxidoreductase [bacterium]|nr:NAD(P)-dependent oxidoreductase [bacterium]